MITMFKPIEILRFINKYNSGFLDFYKIDKHTALSYIETHLKYDTLVTLQDENGKLIAVTRFNIRGAVADCFDTVIHPKHRGLSTLKSLVLKAHLLHPYTEFLQFERRMKYPNKQLATYSIKKFLGE